MTGLTDLAVYGGAAAACLVTGWLALRLTRDPGQHTAGFRVTSGPPVRLSPPGPEVHHNEFPPTGFLPAPPPAPVNVPGRQSAAPTQAQTPPGDPNVSAPHNGLSAAETAPGWESAESPPRLAPQPGAPDVATQPLGDYLATLPGYYSHPTATGTTTGGT